MEVQAYLKDLARKIFWSVFGDGRFYEMLYRRKHGVKYIDRGEFTIMQMRGQPDVLRLRRRFDYSLKLPLDFSVEVPALKVAAVVHIFYIELVEEVKDLLRNIPACDVYISTDDAAKKLSIEETFADYDGGSITVKVFENRGRDIAPTLIGFKNIYRDYDVCVHLHTKKSPHAKHLLGGWGEYLCRSLLGSREVVAGILHVMARDDVGILFPQYFSSIRRSIHWGENYLAAQDLLKRLKISVDEKCLLEFPAGSMFWFKPQALAPILNYGFTFEDFPVERGQTDGTLAHALERVLVYAAEAAGFKYVKITVDEANNGNTPVLNSADEEELAANVVKVWHSVLERHD